MKKICLLALAVVLLAACSETPDGASGYPGLEEGARKVNVRVALPVAGEVSYARSESFPIASAPEVRIENLDVYLFGEQAPGRYVLEKVYADVLADEAFEPVSEQAFTSISFLVEGVNAKKFFFVANARQQASLVTEPVAGTTTESELRSLLSNQITTEAVACPLVMTADAGLTADQLRHGQTVSLGDVMLKRLVARIDILNKENNFTIRRVRMLNARDCSCILPGGDAEAGFVDLPEVTVAEAAPAFGESVESNSLFYPYESVDSQNSETCLIVSGILYQGSNREVEASFKIPFVKDGAAIAIDRNARYQVIINEAFDDSKVDAVFRVLEWNDGGGTEHEVTTDVIRLSGELLAGNKLAVTAAGQYSLGVASRTAWTVTASDSWVTPEAVTEAGQIVATGLNLTVGPNDTGKPRTALVKLTSGSDKNVTYTLVVTQPAEIR